MPTSMKRVAAVGSARYCIVLNLVVHHPGRCLFFADVLMVLSTSQKVT
jgi:hypothetical protein